jgi:hypothetical protein
VREVKLRKEDFPGFGWDEMNLMEVRYPGSSIFKYYHFPDPSLLREFLSRPTIKFA